MTTSIITDTFIDDIRFGRVKQQNKAFVKVSDEAMAKLNAYCFELEAMYDEQSRSSHSDRPKLRAEVKQFLIDHTLVYLDMGHVFVVNPWLSTSVQPTIHRLIRRVMHSGGQLQ